MYVKQPHLSTRMRIGRALRHGSFGDDQATDPDVLAAIHCQPGQTWDVASESCMGAPVPTVVTPTTSPAPGAAPAAGSSFNWNVLDPTSPLYVGGQTTTGSGASIPTILLIGGAAAAAYYLFRKKKGS